MTNREYEKLADAFGDDAKQKILHHPFDINVHKQNFVNYLEVIITSDGTVEYAVPSHMQKLAEVYGKSMDDIFEEYQNASNDVKMTMLDMITDPLKWLCAQTGAIAVWTDGYSGEANKAQKNKLKTLKLNGLYRGPI